jgi:AcrR family transcriptional regulator
MKKDKAPRISKELITKSAIKLIVEGRRPSIRHIANYLNCSAPSIYYYFKSLEEINISICELFFSDGYVAMREDQHYEINYEDFIDKNEKLFIYIMMQFCNFGKCKSFDLLTELISVNTIGKIHGERYLEFQLEGNK